MMKYIYIFLLLSCIANGQPIQGNGESPTDLFNNFQEFTNSKSNVDSAFYCAQKLASDKRYVLLLNDLIHSSFAQHFIQSTQFDKADAAKLQLLKDRRLVNQRILGKMADDTTGALSETARPMFLLTKVQDNRDNPSVLKSLTEEFLDTEIDGKDVYKNRSARYGLMISDIIRRQPELEQLNDKLRGMLMKALKENQIKAEDAPTRILQDKRAWYRYLYAYVNYTESEKTSDIGQKKDFLKTAFNFSPDIIDKNHQSAYFYDMILILGKNNTSFEDEYLDFITTSSEDRAEILSALVKIALVNTGYKDKLKTFYEGGSQPKGFDVYWSELINNVASVARPILLNTINKQLFSSKSQSGKWVLVDFWGTWCGPCREEHPEMQEFYDSTVVRNSGHIALMTIACNDQVEKVSAYMKEKNYSFPVAMSDHQIEKTYVVQGYPTKILITPAGKYVVVPFGINWVDFVKKYSGLE